MAEYLSPGVYVEEFESGLRPMEGVGTSTAGFVGMAEKGKVIGTPEFVTSFADFNRKFGGYLPESAYGEYRYLAYAVEQFFANGGSRCYVMRTVASDAAAAGVTANGISMQAKNPGKWGNEIKVTAVAAPKGKTAVLEATGDDATGKVYTVANGSAFAEGDIIAIRNNGKVTGYNKIAMAQGNTITLVNPVKEDLVDKNPVPKKVLSVCEMNIEIAYRDQVEIYEGVSLNINSASYIAKVLSKSELVDVTAEEGKEIGNPLAVFGAAADAEKALVFLAGGTDGGKKGITDDVFMGKDGGPGKRTGLAAFKELNNVSIMAIPGVTSPAVQLALVAHCTNTGASFAVLDVPQDLTKPQDVLAHREKIDSDYAAMYHPWIQIYDALNKKPAYIPPSGAVCGIYARSDVERGVHKAPANEVVYNCIGLSCLYNKAEQDILNPAGVNLIRALPGQGIRVWGARTCSSNSLWKYVNVRRLFIYLEESIKSQTNWAVFEPNDEMLWARVGRTIRAFLRDMWRSGALVGNTEDQAFYVNIGRDTMSQSDILNGRLICEIGVAPSRPAEFVIFRITQFMEES
ncbi:phage tail sheath subtilisin-like domain-containing protein [Anaerosacchariphilus sp. NSJ-68]|uniref:Phage tail sheath subtilisin-like domain-containing protein n=2 Tax=Lachnospiraceae TaxID=186803 RepID=A0A923LAV8_9FIRM|nr:MULTISPECIES: phage tail sheath subtilisin-like domain-containing protein [Lachnospiraceae]MBC5659190.1 phage tail sheath subtilisin-like domain-containing protein [Anaerosacchariphilus hominis]MBC5696856.1 phage tail sheath subtilisin-like domain-containing protein [Roseburia difficilis]